MKTIVLKLKEKRKTNAYFTIACVAFFIICFFIEVSMETPTWIRIVRVAGIVISAGFFFLLYFRNESLISQCRNAEIEENNQKFLDMQIESLRSTEGSIDRPRDYLLGARDALKSGCSKKFVDEKLRDY